MQKSPFNQIIKNLASLNKNGYIASSTDTMRLHDDIQSGLFLITDKHKNPQSLSIAFKNITDDELQILDEIKFKIFSQLEIMLGRTFSESTNSDACSYTYSFDSDHAGTNPIISVSITDYLS